MNTVINIVCHWVVTEFEGVCKSLGHLVVLVMFVRYVGKLSIFLKNIKVRLQWGDLQVKFDIFFLKRRSECW